MNQELTKILDEIEQDMGMATATSFAEVAARYFQQSAAGQRAVSPNVEPGALLGGLPPLPADGQTIERVAEMLERDVVRESNWLYHPRYMGHQVTAPLPAAVWAESVTAALNQSIAVREMSPALTVIERQIIAWMAGLAGLGEQAGGTFTSGGTEATFTALLAARARALPNAWENGLEGELPFVICGEHAHYAVTRAVAQLGLGLKRVIAVPSRDYRMDVDALEQKLDAIAAERGKVMAVIATAGSTATGSFDDLARIASLCKRHDAWLHVDGAHGASALLSEQKRQLLNGIEQADSIAWDPHKMMLMPLSAGVLLVRNEADLDAAFRQRAPYLFHQTAGERSWDQGARSFQCSRRGDVLKVWVAVQRHGTRAFGVLFDYFSDLTLELRDMLRASGEFDVVHEPQCNILCFRFVGNGGASPERLDALNAQLREAYNTRGTGWITTTVLDGRRVLRTTLLNPRIRTEHLHALVHELREIAADLQKSDGASAR